MFRQARNPGPVKSNRDDTPGDCCGCTCIQQGTGGIVAKISGGYSHTLPPGFHCITPCTEKLAGVVSFKTQFIETRVECPTLDNATVRCTIGTVFKVIPAMSDTAFYKLSATKEQIGSYVVAHLRSEIRGINLDGLFEYRERLAERLNAHLAPVVAGFGHEIVDLLVMEIEPTGQVRYAIDQQKTQFYMRLGNRFQAETERMTTIKNAEANAEVDRLNGIGQAEAQKIISRSMQDGLAGAQVDESTVMAMMLMLQYFDMIKDMSTSAPHPPVYFLPQTKTDGDNSFSMRHRQLKGIMASQKKQINHDDI